MDTVETTTSVLARHPGIPHRPLTVREYHLMGDVGILHEDDRVELIEGQLIAMAPIGSDHSGTINALNRRLVLAIGDHGVVSVQNPVRLSNYTEPQPDFSVLKFRADSYRHAIPRPEDVLLVIEVANSSLSYDRGVKLALYARHGIPEVWIVNIPGQVVEVFRRPEAEAYAEMERVGADGALSLPVPGAPGIPVGAVLG